MMYLNQYIVRLSKLLEFLGKGSVCIIDSVVDHTNNIALKWLSVISSYY